MYVYHFLSYTYAGSFITTAVANVKANVLSSSSIMVEWDKLSDASSYLITYDASAEVSSGSSTVNSDITSYTFNNLKQNTLYTITVQATTSDNRTSAKGNMSVTTYSNGKRFKF